MASTDDQGEKTTNPSSQSPIRRLKSTDLLAGQKRIVIEHEGLDYQLQVTRQGKLILTK